MHCILCESVNSNLFIIIIPLLRCMSRARIFSKIEEGWNWVEKSTLQNNPSLLISTPRRPLSHFHYNTQKRWLKEEKLWKIYKHTYTCKGKFFNKSFLSRLNVAKMNWFFFFSVDLRFCYHLKSLRCGRKIFLNTIDIYVADVERKWKKFFVFCVEIWGILTLANWIWWSRSRVI